jgi:DNA-binding NtrC family response regulator
MASGKILIVDDDRNLLEVLKVRVESAGYDVTTAAKEEDALEAAEGEVFDLSIVDLHLQRRNGISLMKDLRALLPNMPVIILTAQATTESAAQAMRQGACGYLAKPFNSGDLFSHIEQALTNSRSSSEVRRLGGLLEEK